ncbi:hypothetical protein HK099_001755 [Clydaea vesicula]|uniref:Uncharacterized protein n=1 Tax=Clydaea vesicula TaxID=447962 RepID=A0AAD5TTU2_9FUNG|nr:hypothetical protein HK099_001755 [Clydaea vesicula]
MASIWNENVVKRFRSVPPNPRENDFHAPYNKLLCTEFDITGKYSVAPQAYPQPNTKSTIDFFVEYTIEFISSREEADEQIRKRLKDIGPLCPLGNLYGVFAFGTKYAIYNYMKDSRRIEPAPIPSDPNLTVDTAPIERWNKDLMEKDGALHLKELFQCVVQMCEAIG